jgi:hypothetical protein
MSEFDYEKIREIIKDELKPICEKQSKHDIYFFGDKGDNGVMFWIGRLKGHLGNHYIWTTIVIMPTLVGLILLVAGKIHF